MAFRGNEVELKIKKEPKEIQGKKILFFEDYELYKIYGKDKIKVWGRNA